MSWLWNDKWYVDQNHRVIKSVVGSLVVELVSDVELNVGILSQNVEGDKKKEGVYVGGTLRQLEVDVDPDPSKHQQHCYRHQCPYFQTGLVWVDLQVHFLAYCIKQPVVYDWGEEEAQI